MTNLLIQFILFNILNVIIQTIKSIATIKCGKTMASVVNALAYGLYTYIVVLTMCDLPLLWKCLIVAGCNFVGVFAVKFFEEKARKDKLWKIEATIPTRFIEPIDFLLGSIPHSYIVLSDKHTLFNFYCDTQEQSKKVKYICDQYGAKYFASESKTLY